ncbi:MAG: Trm112 family protein [Magnetococcus sp. WYHC-3]
MVDQDLLDALVCPQCRGTLVHDAQNHELICEKDRLAFAIQDDIPVMLVEEARQLPEAP